MGSIKLLIIFSVTALHLAVVTGCIRPNKLVADAKARQFQFKHCWLFAFFGQEAVREFCTIVSLYTFDKTGELSNHMAQKNRRRIRIMFLKRFDIAETAVFVKESILKPLCWLLLAYNAGLRNKLDVNLYSLTGLFHLLIGLVYTGLFVLSYS